MASWLTTRNSNLAAFNAFSINYSTLTGSTSNNVITAGRVNYSTITGSSVAATSVAATSVTTNSLALASTLTGSSIILSGNVGIGSNAPASILHVSGASSTYTNGQLFISDANYTGNQLRLFSYWGGTIGTSWTSIQSMYDTTPNKLALNPNGGNVGIGTLSPNNLLTVGSAVLPVANSAGTTNLVVYGNINCYRNRLIFSNTLTDFNHCIYNNERNIDNEGSFDGIKFNVYAGAWFRVGLAALGTVPTTGLFINSAGKVGIGKTNPQPQAALDVKGVLTVNEGVAAAAAGYFQTIEIFYVGSGATGYGAIVATNPGDVNTRLCLQPYGGNVGIGTDTPLYPLDVNGHIGIPATKYIHFSTYKKTGGAFCIGHAGGTEIFRFVGADDPGQNRISYFGYYTSDNPAGTWNAQLQINHYTGAAYNKANIWGNSSDISIKENIEDTRSYLEDICKLRVVKYSLKEDKLTAPNMIGVIAQEVEQIFPSLIDTVNNIKCVKHSVINVILLKAFQEQHQIVTQQATEIATLKEQMANILAKLA